MRVLLALILALSFSPCFAYEGWIRTDSYPLTQYKKGLITKYYNSQTGKPVTYKFHRMSGKYSIDGVNYQAIWGDSELYKKLPTYIPTQAEAQKALQILQAGDMTQQFLLQQQVNQQSAINSNLNLLMYDHYWNH